jgi:hypothetical protein
LRVQNPWSNAVGPEQEDFVASTHLPDQRLLTNVFSLPWYERARRQYTFKFRKRGKYEVGPVKLKSGDLFGIFERSEQQDPVDLLTVFPELIPFEELGLLADDPFGDWRSRRRLYEDPNQEVNQVEEAWERVNALGKEIYSQMSKEERGAISKRN